MRSRKILALALAIIMVCGSLAACGTSNTGGNQPTPTASAGTAPATSAPAPEEKKVLTITTWDYDTIPQFSPIVEAYEAEHPNVKIEVMDTSATEYPDTLGVTLSAAGPDPDIIFVKYMADVFTLAEKKQILPIDEFIKKDKFDLSLYNGAAEQLQVNGASYALPFRSDWYLLYYNKDLFDAAGIKYPTNDMTWDEYYELCAKITSGEGSAKVHGGHYHTSEAMIGDWAIQDGKNTVVAKDYSFLKPVYEKVVGMQDKGYIMDYSTLKTGNIHYSSVFKNQQCATLLQGTWFIAQMMAAQTAGETNFNWGMVKVPHPDNVEAGYTVGSLTPVAISAYTDEAELAWDFMKFATSEKAADILAEYGVFTGIQTKNAMNTIASSEFFPKAKEDLEALNYVNFVFDRPLDKHMPEIKKVLNEVHEMIMIKAYSIDEGIKEINERVAKIKGW